MRIIVTGGTGNVGVAAVEQLAQLGHKMTVIGRSANQDVRGATYLQCDINDYESLEDAVRGHDAIVHLAAHGGPIGRPGREVFRVNDLGTFNVFEAAAETGIRRVVGASSINAVGYFFGDRSVPISYLPIDEEHPTLATDAYSFSKQVMESIGRYFWERDGISSVMLRLPGVIAHEKVVADHDFIASYDTSVIENLLALPEDERANELARMQQLYDRYRRTHRADKRKPTDPPHDLEAVSGLTRDEFYFMAEKVNLFTYIDELDSAQSIAKSVTAEYEGSHPLFVNAKRNTIGLPVEEVAKLYAADEPTVRPSRPGDAAIVSIDRARELIGFEPEWAITGKLARGHR
ncbi:MAG: NAD-dependent epimerase/dehydratase family protein [Spirochaetota bacterium]